MLQTVDYGKVVREDTLQTPSTSIEEAKRIAELSSLTYRRVRSYYLASSNTPPKDEPLEKSHWRSIGASRIRVDEAIREELERFYFLRNPVEVVRFVGGSISLLSWLRPTYRMIHVYFPRSEVYLEVVTDPEVEEDTKLVASVVTDLDSSEAVERLGQFDRRWLSGVPRQVEDKFVVTVEF